MLSGAQLAAQCDDMQSQMERNVFAFPPSDWAAFQNRLGQWQGVENIRVMAEKMEHDEQEKEKDL
jgi:hypothetical protein